MPVGVRAMILRILKLLKRGVLESLWRISSRRNEDLFVAYLHKEHRDPIVRRFSRPGMFDWDAARMPETLSDFGDLTCLFWPTPLNRGLLRQDMDEAWALYKTVHSIPRPRGVEIGRYHGASTVLLALTVGPEGRLLSIDIEPRNDESLRAVLRRYGLENRVELMVADANDVEIDHPLDFVFIDGDHRYEGARRDHNRWGRLVRPGGYVIHHDMANARPYATQWKDLARLRDDILGQQAVELELACEVGSMAVFRRTDAPFNGVHQA